MKSRHTAPILLGLLALAVGPGAARAAGSTESGWVWSFVWVSGDPAHVRTRPDVKERSTGTLTRGDRVRVRREKNPGAPPDWLLVAPAGRTSGWVQAKLLSNARLNALPAVQPAPVVPAARTGENDAADRTPLTDVKVDARALTAPGPGGATADDAATELATLQAVVDRLYPPGKPDARARDMSIFLRDLP